MRNDHSIAGTTILQTTLEDADNTQFFIDGKTNPVVKVGRWTLRFSIWLFCCVRLTTSTHDIDFKFSGVKECNKTRLKT